MDKQCDIVIESFGLFLIFENKKEEPWQRPRESHLLLFQKCLGQRVFYCGKSFICSSFHVPGMVGTSLGQNKQVFSTNPFVVNISG
jgi:hypothetical protein